MSNQNIQPTYTYKFYFNNQLVETINCPYKINIYQTSNHQKSNDFTNTIYSCELDVDAQLNSGKMEIFHGKSFIQVSLMKYFQVNKIGINDIQHINDQPNQFDITLNQNEHIIKLPIQGNYHVWKVSNKNTIENIEQKWINSVNNDIKLSNRMDAVHSVVYTIIIIQLLSIFIQLMFKFFNKRKSNNTNIQQEEQSSEASNSENYRKID